MLQNVNKAQIKVKTKNDNVAGVNLPVFESYQVNKTNELFEVQVRQFITRFRMPEMPMSLQASPRGDNSSRG